MYHQGHNHSIVCSNNNHVLTLTLLRQGLFFANKTFIWTNVLMMDSLEMQSVTWKLVDIVN